MGFWKRNGWFLVGVGLIVWGGWPDNEFIGAVGIGLLISLTEVINSAERAIHAHIDRHAVQVMVPMLLGEDE